MVSVFFKRDLATCYVAHYIKYPECPAQLIRELHDQNWGFGVIYSCIVDDEAKLRAVFPRVSTDRFRQVYDSAMLYCIRTGKEHLMNILIDGYAVRFSVVR